MVVCAERIIEFINRPITEKCTTWCIIIDTPFSIVEKKQGGWIQTEILADKKWFHNILFPTLNENEWLFFKWRLASQSSLNFFRPPTQSILEKIFPFFLEYLLSTESSLILDPNFQMCIIERGLVRWKMNLKWIFPEKPNLWPTDWA